MFLSNFIQLVLVVGSAVLCALCTIEVRYRLQKRGIVTQPAPLPTGVKNNTTNKPVATGGGIGVLFVVAATSLVLFVFKMIPINAASLSLLAGSAVVCLSGFYVDKQQMSARTHLGVQTFAVLLAVGFVPVMGVSFLPIWAEKTVLALLWLGLMTSFKRMDNVNGYVAQQNIFLAIVMALMFPLSAYHPLFLVMGGAGVGFLMMNWYPAKIVWGQAGVSLLGFLFAGFMALHLTPQTLWFFLTVTLLFTADSLLTAVSRRVQQHTSVVVPHVYEQAQYLLLFDNKVARRGVFVNFCLLMMAAIGFATGYGFFTFLFALLFMAVLAWLVQHWRRTP